MHVRDAQIHKRQQNSILTKHKDRKLENNVFSHTQSQFLHPAYGISYLLYVHQ